MTARIKRHIISKISHLVNEKHIRLLDKSNMSMLPATLSPYTIHLPTKDTEFLDTVNFTGTGLSDEYIENITIHHSPRYRGLSFKMNPSYFVETFLNDLLKSDLAPAVKKNPKNIVMDYSSPNIAKPFHMGHLRSTIIGNFIANINEHFGDKVTRINYLGDWGTQFGLLRVGVDSLNYNDEQIKENPMELLYKAYVHANQLAENDDNVSTKAKEAFSNLEKGTTEDLNKWELYRKYTVDELKNTYERLGVKFDEYHWESMYGSDVANKIIHDLINKNILKVHEDGHKTVAVNDREVTLQKCDGSSLYLTRDIAAVLDRYDKYSFNKMLYIVDNAQTDHFASLFNILKQMDVPFKDRCEHIKFGRVRGLSTRKGNVVFLKDILNEAKEKMYKQQKESPNTRVNLDDESITDVLGITAVIINDLNQKRQKDYDFVWEKALHSQGDSGIKLQYSHCRLWRLENHLGIELPTSCNSQLLQEPEAVDLIHRMAKFDYYLQESRNRMEACMFLNFLFPFTQSISLAFKALKIKDTEKDVAQQRLLLFHCARKVLKRSMEILGVKPLNQM